MGLFTRRNMAASAGASALTPIDDFWRWWRTTGEAGFSTAIASGQYADLPALMAAKVAAIHPELHWETSEGGSAHHRLCVTASGVAELRRVAERWLRAAPPAGENWEFAAARGRSRSALTAPLDLSGTRIDLGLARVMFEAHDERQSVDVRVFHPAFASIGAQDSAIATFIMLDRLLGEDDVERWLGGVESTASDAVGSVPLADLAGEIDAMASRHPEPTWIIADAVTATGNPLMRISLHPLRWIDRPLFDLHTEIRLSYSGRHENGLPSTEGLAALRAYENGLLEALGDNGLLVAFETAEGLRTFHLYSDSENLESREVIERFRPNDGGVKSHSIDPRWQKVRHFG